jgi:hypothetical protein
MGSSNKGLKRCCRTEYTVVGCLVRDEGIARSNPATPTNT